MIVDAGDNSTDRLLLTAREAAALLSVSEKTLQRLSARGNVPGKIPAIAIGKRGVRYTRAALQKWIADQQAAPPEDPK